MICYDYAVIGSGFGGSVSAMRLTEKGYRVLVLERGKRFRDQDFAHSNWNIWKYLWAPTLRCFGILQISLLKGVMVLHGSGVGGGSLGYAGVLVKPSDRLFDAPAWRRLADWKRILQPHYETACRMLGVTRNPRLWHADEIMQEIAAALGQEDSFEPTNVGVYFGNPEREGEQVPDPYFNGEGPSRRGCIHCGGCMVGCRYNAKNTLVKNYLYFAEKWGAEIRAEAEVMDVLPLGDGEADGARYEVVYKQATAWLLESTQRIRTKNVIFSAGVLGTLKLLFHCRDETRSLPELSPRLGEVVRTNSETLLGSINRTMERDFSEGIAITSVFKADEVTAIEPVRFPDGSSLLRYLGAPMIDSGDNLLVRWLKSLWEILTHPVDFAISHILPGWACRATIILAMQTEDNLMRLRPGRSLFSFLRNGLVTETDRDRPIPPTIEIGHQVTKTFAEKTNGIPAGSVAESLLNIPITAHILGGCPFGLQAKEGVIGLDCQIHNYPGLYVVDGSIVPANPGVNPSLTITALAEYAMSQIEPKAE